MAKRARTSLTEHAIIELFLTNKVSEIVYISRTDELEHLKHVNHTTKDKFLCQTTKAVYMDIKNDPKCMITITDYKAIRKNKNDKLIISTKLLLNLDISNIRQDFINLELAYDLTQLPDY